MFLLVLFNTGIQTNPLLFLKSHYFDINL